MKKLITLGLLVAGLSCVTPSFASDTALPAAEESTVVLYVDINNDSAEKMSDLLNGVGLKKAQAIVEYRQANGPFLSVEDLLNVPGICPATLEKNRQNITVGESEN